MNQKLIESAKKILPRSVWMQAQALKRGVILACNYAYDGCRFWRYSSFKDYCDYRPRLESLIRIDAHRIEKGLSVVNPRPGFGRAALANLYNNCMKLLAFSPDDDLVHLALAVMKSYLQHHGEPNETSKKVEQYIVHIKSKLLSPARGCGGIVQIERDKILAACKLNLTPFFASRYSIRDFTEELVPVSIIEAAVGMALKTPSVCNRQAWRVHLYSNPEDKAKVLSHQNGSRSFGHLASHILLVTADLRGFVSAAERNQCWIDGGMFAMSVVYALHSLGIGTCCLNMSLEKAADASLRNDLQLPCEESVIMQIAIGHLPETLNVPISSRKKLSEILLVH